MSADQQGKDHRESIFSRHYTADGAASSAVGVAVRRRWHRQKATFKAHSTVLVVLDCSVVFEKKKNSQKRVQNGFLWRAKHRLLVSGGCPFHYFRGTSIEVKSGDELLKYCLDLHSDLILICRAAMVEFSERGVTSQT